MPCYSRVEVKVTDSARLVDALRALGWTIETNDANGIYATGGADGFRAIRFRLESGTATATGNTEHLPAIMRQYAEIGVRQFAIRKGYQVTKTGARLTLTGRE